MSKSRGSSPNPRKFSEKIALLNRKEAEATAEFEKILKEVEETRRVSPQPQPYWCPPTRSASFSNRLACDQQLGPQPQQDQYYSYQNSGNYLTQPVQFQSQHNQLLQQRAQVANDIRQQQQQHNHQQHHNNNNNHHQQQQQNHQRPTIYVDHQNNQQSNFVQHPTALDDTMQPMSTGVPNIEVFAIDEYQQLDEYRQPDEYQQQQYQTPSPIPTPENQDSLTNGYYRNDCSYSPISSTRSLPDISSLSVSSPHPSQIMVQPDTSQRLIPPTGNSHFNTTSTTNTMSPNNNFKSSSYNHINAPWGNC